MRELRSRSPALSLACQSELPPKLCGLDRGRPLLLLPESPTPLPLPRALQLSGRSRAADPVLRRFGPSLTPPAAEAPDGCSSRRARGPQTPPRSSRRSLPPSQLLRPRLGPSALRPGQAPPQAPPQARVGAAARSRGAPEPCARGPSPAGPGNRKRW
nr:uncharacterized protein LOC112919624 [Vulpes vulpes]